MVRTVIFRWVFCFSAVFGIYQGDRTVAVRLIAFPHSCGYLTAISQDNRVCSPYSWVVRSAASASCFPGLEGFLISMKINIASVPDCDGLNEHAFFFASLDIAYHVDPGANLHLVALDAFKDMDNINICDFCRGGCGVVVLQSKRCCLNHIFINAAIISTSSLRT